jgi:16S rRNA A1518/A1519 N6-dimethyltransferase RsmA/KsgA/DIM1 with predicted DNA glycosylase/AP lyase activity
VSVFLRWGIFGIIGVAALMYAYNASKRMAEKHSTHEPPVVAVEQRETAAAPAPEPVSAPTYKPDPHCQAELVVAQRALEARRQGEPIDRLLRIQEIAFQEPPRRQRLEQVATRWYQLVGDEPIPEALSIAVISDCVRFSPAP